MVNMMKLHKKYKKSAEAMCDQHVNKLVTEATQSAWIMVSVLEPALIAKAKAADAGHMEPKKDHSLTHLHPLVRWMALCRGNCVEILERALALADEYTFRYKKTHACVEQLQWLLANPVDFNTQRWHEWVLREQVGFDGKRKPYSAWFAQYAYYEDEGKDAFVWKSSNRNDGRRTRYPQIMDEDLYPDCRNEDDAVEAYRKYYIRKGGGVVNGVKTEASMKQPMRYFTRPPPDWLTDAGVVVQREPKTKQRRPSKVRAKAKIAKVVRPVRRIGAKSAPR